jgi:hypothetical protein
MTLLSIDSVGELICLFKLIPAGMECKIIIQ